MADGDGGFRPFKQITRDRLLHEMLGSAKKGSEWKVLIMDELTVKVMSCACKMADLTDCGISLVEDINKRRQPLPALEAVYFIQPTHSVRKFINDMSGQTPLYKRAYVFLSSPISSELLSTIKSNKSLMSRIAALREVNLEYLTVDVQGFVTDQGGVLQQLFGGEDKDCDNVISTTARRLATLFASLKEFPLVRFRAARSAAANSTYATTQSDLIPTKLAACIWDRIMKYKSSLPDYPQTETCELLILDRSVDLIAPVIHEWTYEAMCHDLLSLEGNKYNYEVTTSSGNRERKDVLLDDHDPVWAELRDLHIADVNIRLNEKMTQFGSKNKAAEIRLGGKDGQNLTTRDMHLMVQALPQYRDQLEKLSLHIDIATVLNDKIKEGNLSVVGHLEQNLAFGDATSKDLINFLSTTEWCGRI